jgi:hypothetical protein
MTSLSGYLRGRARNVRPCSCDAATLRHLLNFLRREGVIGTEKIAARRLTPAERCVQKYAQYSFPSMFDSILIIALDGQLIRPGVHRISDGETQFFD